MLKRGFDVLPYLFVEQILEGLFALDRVREGVGRGVVDGVRRRVVLHLETVLSVFVAQRKVLQNVTKGHVSIL